MAFLLKFLMLLLFTVILFMCSKDSWSEHNYALMVVYLLFSGVVFAL